MCCHSVNLLYFWPCKCKHQQKEGRAMFEISSVYETCVCYVLWIYFLQIFIILNLYFLIFSCFDRGLVVSQQTYPYRPNPLSPRNILNVSTTFNFCRSNYKVILHERSWITGWSKEILDCNLFLADRNISKSEITQWSLIIESLYWQVFVFWWFKSVRCVEFAFQSFANMEHLLCHTRLKHSDTSSEEQYHFGVLNM